MPKKIIGIFATTFDGAFGREGGLPWGSNKADMKHFKETTTGNTVAMGRATWNSLPDRFKPLPDRMNVVIASQPLGYRVPIGVNRVSSIGELLSMKVKGDLYVIGGKALLETMYEYLDEILVTWIRTEHEADTYLDLGLLGYNFSQPDGVLYADDDIVIMRYLAKRHIGARAAKKENS